MALRGILGHVTQGRNMSTTILLISPLPFCVVVVNPNATERPVCYQQALFRARCSIHHNTMQSRLLGKLEQSEPG